MSKNFGIVEIGSTNTKGYLYLDDNIQELNFCNIDFKKNYKLRGELLIDDEIKLYDYIKKMQNVVSEIYVYGTSIFRELSEPQLLNFINNLKSHVNVYFEVVSSDLENEYTVHGVLRNVNNYDDNIGVLIGGGGSTEIAICNSKKIIEKANTSFGVLDVLEKYPDLSNDIATTHIDLVSNYITNVLNFPINKANILVLAGGSFLLRYINAQYPIELNTIFSDENQPYIISKENNYQHDLKYYYEITLNSLRKFSPENPKWWDGTRAMCGFVNSVSNVIGAKILIPTNISMIYGIVEKIRN